MTTLEGTTLSGRYRLEARIAAGGFSTVYRALDERLERLVAVKLMNREVAADSSQLERFRREARAVAQLSHPNVVGVIDTGEDDERPYIVLEYVEGETLKQRIRRLGRLPVAEATEYAIEIARALGAAHERHIVHRDVKPQNVLIDAEGNARVTDFGIARTLEEEGLTVEGRVLGSTDYVSPEQALGEDVTGQSDLYSLGVVLYEMLTGDVPFHGESQVAVAMKHVRETIPDVRALRPDAPASLAAVVATATARQRSDRYADEDELIADLTEVLAAETSQAAPPVGEATAVLRMPPAPVRRRAPLSSRRGRWAAVVGLAALTAAVAAALVLYLAPRAPHGAGPAPRRRTVAAPRRVTLCSTCAHDYNPDAISGPKDQNPQLVAYAIDGNPSTAWVTQQYYDHALGKPGVGLYLDTGSGVSAGSVVLDTDTPGWSVTILATNQPPNPDAFNSGPGGWRAVGSAAYVDSRQTIALSTGGARYRYYLVWITSLGGREQVSINEVSLYTR